MLKKAIGLTTQSESSKAAFVITGTLYAEPPPPAASNTINKVLMNDFEV